MRDEGANSKSLLLSVKKVKSYSNRPHRNPIAPHIPVRSRKRRSRVQIGSPADLSQRKRELLWLYFLDHW
jgi:hypothetical protein